VRLVVADTGPINYLVLIGCIDLLPRLFEKVILPSAVEAELNVRNTPALVRNWAANRPAWVGVHQPRGDFDTMDPLLIGIHEGEKAAIVLACALDADLLLMNDRKGVHAAREKGLRVTGTLGILDLATQGGRVDFSEADFSRAIERLRRTNFRVADALLDALLEKHREGKGRL
jgi:predicted nucleic acid-binding protein